MATKISRAERVKELSEMLDGNVRDILTSERYLDYLDYMKTFSNYSARNQMLIMLQKPSASLVKGFKAWSANPKYKRYVKKGAKAIWILAPMSFKKVVEEKEVDKDNNSVKLIEKEVTIPTFRPIPVYDISDTEGDDIPIIDMFNFTSGFDGYRDFLDAITNISPAPIIFDTIDGLTSGQYNKKSGEIVIDKTLSESVTLSVAVHEVAHAILHSDEDCKKDKATKEVEAESVSYIVCSYYGIDTGDSHFEYIANWSSDKSLKELYNSLGVIKKQLIQ